MGRWKQFVDVVWKMLLGMLALFCVMCIYFSFFRASYANITIDTYNPFVLLLASAFYIALLLACRKWMEYASERQLKIIAAVLLLIFFIGLLFVGLSTRIIPKVDLRHAYIEAINMLETGEITDEWQFGRYPHQKAVVFILYFLYRAANVFGYTDYRVLGILFNAVMMTLALFFLYRFVLEHKGYAAAITAEMIFVCSPVLYFYVGYFYSDTLCLPFMSGGLWLAGRGLKESVNWKKAGLFCVSAIVLALGAEVRAPVIFVLAAVFLGVISKENRKAAIAISAFLIIGLAIGTVAYRQIDSTYAGNLTRTKDLSSPVTHYVMMGSNEETIGGWSSADVKLTDGLATQQEKIEGNLAVIQERIRDMGFGGCLKLIKNKMALVWGDGRMGYQSYNAQMEQYNFVYEYSKGDKATFLLHIMQFMRCAMYILILAASVTLYRKKDLAFSDMTSVVTCLAGVAFYILWETQPKYSLMFLPLMSVLAGTGIEGLYAAGNIQHISFCGGKTDSGENTITLTRSDFKKAVCGLSCMAIFITALLWVGNYRKYAGDVKERSEMRVNQEMANKTRPINQEGLLQSFQPKKEFNCAAVKFRNNKAKGNQYFFQILDDRGNVIVEQEFAADKVSDDRYKYFRFDTIYPAEDDMYYIKVFAAEAYETPLEVSAVYAKQSEAYASGYDSYVDGDMMGKDIPEHTDMAFRVTNVKMRPIVSRKVYCFLSCGSLLLEGMAVVLLCEERKGKRTKNMK